MASNQTEQNEEQLKETEELHESKETQKITIELYKYKTLVDALGDRAKVLRVIFTIFFLGVLLFAGITIITLSIKRLYPYSDITTNGLGATTIKSEKNEVSYWLFNTATVWANSGIAVDRGDIITVRASGKSHTAIHHLYSAAKNNKEKYNEWVGSEGEPDIMSNERDMYRRRFRIFPDMPSGALLMQVSEGDPKDSPRDGHTDDFYFIGKERQHIYINNKGTLYFAVNDIILNRSTIANMMWENIRLKYLESDEATQKMINNLIIKEGLNETVHVDQGLHFTQSDGQKEISLMNKVKTLFDQVFLDEVKEANKTRKLMKTYPSMTSDSLINSANMMWNVIKQKSVNNPSLKDSINHYLKADTSFAQRVRMDETAQQLTSKDPIKWLDITKYLFDLAINNEPTNAYPPIGKMRLGYSYDNDSLVCELSYYYGDTLDDNNNNRKIVWFDDNIGSFLIVVEKNK